MLLEQDYSFLFNLDAQQLFDSCLLAAAVFVLFILMSYLLFDPVRKFLQDRQDRIENDITSARADKEAAMSVKAEYDRKLAEVDKEAENILSDARNRALANQNKIIQEAKAEADAIIKRAREEAELEQRRVADEVKTQMIELASAMAGKVIGDSMDVNIQSSLVDETLKEMGESTWLS